MTFSRRSKKGLTGFDMTPMIDVVLQLIIFFLYTAHFTSMTRSPIDLPLERGEDLLTAPGAIVIDIDEDGDYRIERDEVSLSRIETIVSVELERVGGPAGLEVLVRPDRNVPAGHINELARRLQAMGVRNWQLGTADQGG